MNCQQLLITPDTAAILGWTVLLSSDADGVEFALDRRLAFFECDRVIPIVAEVIVVGEADDRRSQQVVQGHAIFVGDIVDSVAIAILLAADVEGMEVAIMPAHRRLDRLVQVAERHRAGMASRRQTVAWCRAASP